MAGRRADQDYLVVASITCLVHQDTQGRRAAFPPGGLVALMILPDGRGISTETLMAPSTQRRWVSSLTPSRPAASLIRNADILRYLTQMRPQTLMAAAFTTANS